MIAVFFFRVLVEATCSPPISNVVYKTHIGSRRFGFWQMHKSSPNFFRRKNVHKSSKRNHLKKIKMFQNKTRTSWVLHKHWFTFEKWIDLTPDLPVDHHSLPSFPHSVSPTYKASQICYEWRLAILIPSANAPQLLVLQLQFQVGRSNNGNQWGRD